MTETLTRRDIRYQESLLIKDHQKWKGETDHRIQEMNDPALPPLGVIGTNHLSHKIIGTILLSLEMSGTGLLFQGMTEIYLLSLEMSGIVLLSQGMKGNGHPILERKEIDILFLEMKEIFHFHQEEAEIVGHHLRGMKERDGLLLSLQVKGRNFDGPQGNTVLQEDPCLPGAEMGIEGDTHLMRTREEDAYLHLLGHHLITSDGDDLRQWKSLEAGLHLLRSSIALVALYHHHGIEREETVSTCCPFE